VNRSIIYDQEQIDPFDVLWLAKDTETAIGALMLALAGQSTTVVTGFGASATSPASLGVTLAAGGIYQQAPIDASAYGALPVDETVIQKQGVAASQSAVLSISALSAGQSQWALIQASFASSDIVRPTDPTGGVLNYFDSADPTEWFQGPNGNGQPQPTVRLATVSISIAYGTPATSGSQAPPNPSSGCVPLYLIDLAYGQTAITSGQILVAGPSVGINVPSNYPTAPFLAGILNSHHNGTTGQAPKIKLTSEVQGVLPAANGGASNPAVMLTGASQTYSASQVGAHLLRSNGGAIMSDTLPSGSNALPANGRVVFENIDTTALLIVSPQSGATLDGVAASGGSLILLGPGQTAAVDSDGTNYWTAWKPGRCRLGAQTNFFYASNGSNGNNGLTFGAPWLTASFGYAFIQENIDLNGFQIFLQPAAGTFTAAESFTGPLFGKGGQSAFTILGNPSSPSSYVYDTAGGSPSFSIDNGAQINFNGLEVISGGAGLQVTNGAFAAVQNMIFGASNTAHMNILNAGSRIWANGNYSIVGSAPTHVSTGQQASFQIVTPLTVTLTGTPAFTEFANAIDLSLQTWSAATFNGSATGQRYEVANLSVIDTGGGGANFLPGNSAGSASGGGQYV
jgi:hypothetical protein